MNNKAVNEVLKIFNNKWNPQVILYGPPGTSKTYSATIIAAAMLAGADKDDAGEYSEDKIRDAIKNHEIVKEIKDDEKKKEFEGDDVYELSQNFLALDELKNNYKLVQFHPSYSYEDFVRGITVKPDGNGGITYEVEPKIIESFINTDSNKKVKNANKVLVIDEINRAPLASVLGELIYGLEYRNNEVTTPYELVNKDKEGNPELDANGNTSVVPLIIPPNLYIIGTMNTADRSIGSMDYAVRRRFAFVLVPSEEGAIESSWKNPSDGKLATELYKSLMNQDEGIFNDNLIADKELDVNDIKIGHTYFLGKEDFGIDYLIYRIIYQIWPIYNEYIKDGLISNEDGRANKAFADALKKVNDLYSQGEIDNFVNETLLGHLE